MAKGIRERHSRSCRTTVGGRCSCEPSFEANVWDGVTETRYRYTAKSMQEAQAWRADALRALRRGRELPGRSTATLREVCEHTLALMRQGVVLNRAGQVYKPQTIRMYEHNLSKRVYGPLGAMPVSEVDDQDLQELMDGWLAEGLSPHTIRATVIPLARILRRELERGRIKTNPVAGLKLPAVRGRRDRIADPTEAAALLAAVPERDRAIWATAMYAGLRCGELQALRVDRVRLDAGVIDVVAGWDRVEGEIETKSRRVRSVPICSPLREVLAADLLRNGRRATPSARAFGSTDVSPFTPSEVQRRADKAWTDRGLRRITFHECRHTFASHMIAAGVNAKDLSEYMGHASVRITFDLYGHLMPGSEKEAATLLDGYLAAAVGGDA